MCESKRERERERERMDYSLSINRHDGFARKCQSICVVKQGPFSIKIGIAQIRFMWKIQENTFYIS